ncbi:MAG: hypothetical protein KDB69_00610 [Acidimicrobiia bacterium]|nr:hypothetical protein [Acidimicrobiia bacterium]
MSGDLVRIAIPIAVVVVAIGVGLGMNRLRRPIHPTVSVGDVGDRPGVVVFTSTDCSGCKRAIERLKRASIVFREVTYELEPQRFETWGVVAVPLTVVVDGDGKVEAAMTGVPSKRHLRRATAAAGIR